MPWETAANRGDRTRGLGPLVGVGEASFRAEPKGVVYAARSRSLPFKEAILVSCSTDTP